MAHTVNKSWPLNSKELTIWSLSPPTIKNWVLWIYSYISDIKAKVIYAQNSSLPNYSTAYSDTDLLPLYLYGTLYSVVHHYAPLPDCLFSDFTLIPWNRPWNYHGRYMTPWKLATTKFRSSHRCRLVSCWTFTNTPQHISALLHYQHWATPLTSL